MMKFKRILGALLASFLIMGLLPVSTVQTFAATEINSIALTGNITPAKDGDMTFAAVPKNANCTVIQIWENMDNKKGFTNSDEYNSALESEEMLIPEAERKFEQGTTYMFAVLITTQGADVKFASNMTVSVEQCGNLILLEDLGDEMAAYGLHFNIGNEHIHVSSSEYGKNDVSHWLKCPADDDFIFEYTEEPHNVDETGVCEVCGYTVAEEDATKLISQPNTSITVDCGGTIELTVEATGRNLKYDWTLGKASSKVDFIDSDNFRGYGVKVSGSDTATLKIENCNYKLDQNPIVCRVTGMWKEAETDEINITVTHRSEVYVAVDENGHKVQCGCGKLIQSTEEHTYNSGSVCEKCGYEKGSIRTKFREATLELPDFSDKNYAKTAGGSATLQGTGIKEGTTGIKKILFTNYDNVLENTSFFEKGKGYGVRIYPELEDNFYMDTESSFLIYITYKGEVKRGYAQKDDDGECFVSISLGYPYVRKVVRFDLNGGAGTQVNVYADEHGYVYFPEKRIYKYGDEFYAWEYNGKLYAEDPNEYEPVYIEEEYAMVKAIWKKQLINNISVLMGTVKHGKKVSEIKFSVPQNSEYSVAGATWYEDGYQDITGNELGLKLGDDDTLDKKKSYNVTVTLQGIGNGFADEPAIYLNLRNIEEFKKPRLGYLTFVLHIKGDDADITVAEPIEGMKLDPADDIKITSSILYIDPQYTFWTSDEADYYTGQYDSEHIVSRENPYYLNLRMKYNENAKNTIVFGRIISINGKEYKLDSPWYNTENIRMLFEVRDLYVTISESSDGMINIESPKAMNVTFAMALYDSNKTLKKTVWKEELALTKGKNEINFITLDTKNGPYMAIRNKSDSVKVMVFENADSLKPLDSVYNYRYRYSN